MTPPDSTIERDSTQTDDQPSFVAEHWNAQPTEQEQATGNGSPDNARLLIVLPAFNEEEAIEPLLESIDATMRDAGREHLVIVVDDGSSDDTARIVSQMSFRSPVHLVSHKVNSGLAAALRTGLTTAAELSRPEDVIFTMDADNTHPPGLMIRMLSMIQEGHDVVIGSRFQAGARVIGVPPIRVLMSIGARTLFTVMFPIRGVRDYTCGFRAYRATVLQAAMADYGDKFVSEQGFSCMVDVLLKLRRRGLVMGEAPMILRYDQKGGASKMRVARTVWQTLSLILRRRLVGAKG